MHFSDFKTKGKLFFFHWKWKVLLRLLFENTSLVKTQALIIYFSVHVQYNCDNHDLIVCKNAVLYIPLSSMCLE